MSHIGRRVVIGHWSDEWIGLAESLDEASIPTSTITRRVLTRIIAISPLSPSPLYVVNPDVRTWEL